MYLFVFSYIPMNEMDTNSCGDILIQLITSLENSFTNVLQYGIHLLLQLPVFLYS